MDFKKIVFLQNSPLNHPAWASAEDAEKVLREAQEHVNGRSVDGDGDGKAEACDELDAAQALWSESLVALARVAQEEGGEIRPVSGSEAGPSEVPSSPAGGKS